MRAIQFGLQIPNLRLERHHACIEPFTFLGQRIDVLEEILSRLARLRLLERQHLDPTRHARDLLFDPREFGFHLLGTLILGVKFCPPGGDGFDAFNTGSPNIVVTTCQCSLPVDLVTIERDRVDLVTFHICRSDSQVSAHPRLPKYLLERLLMHNIESNLVNERKGVLGWWDRCGRLWFKAVKRHERDTTRFFFQHDIQDLRGCFVRIDDNMEKANKRSQLDVLIQMYRLPVACGEFDGSVKRRIWNLKETI